MPSSTKISHSLTYTQISNTYLLTIKQCSQAPREREVEALYH
jgi:hypothetical protein